MGPFYSFILVSQWHFWKFSGFTLIPCQVEGQLGLGPLGSIEHFRSDVHWGIQEALNVRGSQHSGFCTKTTLLFYQLTHSVQTAASSFTCNANTRSPAHSLSFERVIPTPWLTLRATRESTHPFISQKPFLNRELSTFKLL